MMSGLDCLLRKHPFRFRLISGGVTAFCCLNHYVYQCLKFPYRISCKFRSSTCLDSFDSIFGLKKVSCFQLSEVELLHLIGLRWTHRVSNKNHFT